MVELDITNRYRQEIVWQNCNPHGSEENHPTEKNIQCPAGNKTPPEAAPMAALSCNDSEGFTELCVNALCPFSTGDIIGHMTGFLHEVSKEKLAQLEACNSNFSVLETISTKERFHVLLGPARFINHDCNPNVKVSRPLI